MLTIAQGGGRKGCSAIDQAVQHIVETKIVHLRQQPSINIYLDLRTCFNLMVKACHSLSCLCYRADPAYVKLRAQTQHATHYHVKHSHGISKDYNSYSTINPWYGAGQGAVNAAICWIILSCCLIQAYLSQAHQWVMHHPNQTTALHQSIDAFIDDTTLIIAWTTQSTYELIQQAQHNLTLWSQLL